MKFYEQVEMFIVRRAFRASKVVRNDIMMAFNGAIKEARASQLDQRGHLNENLRF